MINQYENFHCYCINITNMLTKDLPVKIIAQFSFIPVIISSVWATILIVAYIEMDFRFLAIPFLPISLLGIAVSFYLGFKNNASYERQYEARKNWGSITNDSRAFMSLLETYIPKDGSDNMIEILKRHIAWLYAHTFFLRHKRMEWEHNKSINNKYRDKFQKEFNINTNLAFDISKYISTEELHEVENAVNKASKLLQIQSKSIKKLSERQLIDDLRLIELQNHITKLYEHQGKNERIKTFPLPRQYANYANLFVLVFVALLPLGLLSEMQKINIWLTVPFSGLISWVFLQMEMIGDYSENPFEGLILDIPITAITRNIEIEILEFIGEKELLNTIKVKEGILM
jgi:putative membrane protein